ncbi:serine/threonine-protein kinase SBK1-like [Watersipora subatra]|uniref:serine/threonine-protein kinase SBK1-like n=1 Tax=Watersipora subatra TaxID=2589382 RepID=UPI00355C38A2
MAVNFLQTRDKLLLHEVSDLYNGKELVEEGSYGKVYRVICKRTKDTFAMKALSKSQITFNTFKREFNYSCLLATHPAVVTTYTAAFQTPSTWNLVQEMAAGSLENVVTLGVGVEAEQCKIIIRQVTSALQFIHSKKLCHGDVRPSNILFFNRQPWVVKLADFGLTCKVKTQVRKRSANTMFTPPEVCQLICNECYLMEQSIDVWHVGITLYFLLTGILPWSQADKSDKAYSTFLSWREYARHQPPPGWGRFNKKIQKLFRKLLNPTGKDRCSVAGMNKYYEAEWTTRVAQLERVGESGEANKSMDSEETEYQHKLARETLQNHLAENGVVTKVGKSWRRERVNRWVEESSII